MAIQLVNQNGMVNVTGWDREEVQVRVVNGRGVENISVRRAGGRMTVRTLAKTPANPLGAGAQYEIHVPRSLARIEARTSNGGVRVTDCNGTVVAETSNGAIQLAGPCH
jgi:hypothetical protein